MADQSESEKESGGKVTFGVPGIATAEIPVRRWLPLRMQRWLSKTPQADLFLVPWMRAQISAKADDDGELGVYLCTLNQSTKEMRVERLFLERLIVNGSYLNETAPLFTPPQGVILPRKFQEVYFRMPLHAPAIRLLLQVITKAPNLFSTPYLELTIVGAFEVSTKGRRTMVNFTVKGRPELILQCPSAKAVRE